MEPLLNVLCPTDQSRIASLDHRTLNQGWVCDKQFLRRVSGGRLGLVVSTKAPPGRGACVDNRVKTHGLDPLR